MSPFTRYIGKGHESFERGLYAVSTSLGQALTASIGGTLVARLGFEAVFIIAGGTIIASSLVSLTLHRELSSSSLWRTGPLMERR